jgi:IS4 transposase
VVERKPTDQLKNISSDQIIEFKGFSVERKMPYQLRRIRSKDPEKGNCIVLLTNQFECSAATIAKIYKDRGQIVLFFKP